VEDVDVTGLIRQDQQGVLETGSVPVKTAGGAQPRQVGSPSNVRLAVLALLIVLVGAAAGGLGSMLLPDEYAARAQVEYSLRTAVPNELLREDRRLETQLVLLRSGIVLAPVASDNGMTPEDLANEVSAEVVNGSEIIEVQVRDRTRERAQKLLTGVVAQYVRDANSDWQDPVLSYLESRLSEVQKKLRAPDVSQRDASGLAQQEQVLIGLRDARQSQLSTNRDSPSSGPPARIVVPPYSVGKVSPRPLRAIGAGAATALVVAAFVVLFVARRRLRS
jgi:uncharacterized protein involved in exopolysaccharide biosynthesis